MWRLNMLPMPNNIQELIGFSDNFFGLFVNQYSNPEEMLLLSCSQDIVSLNHDGVILTMLCRWLLLASAVHSHRALLRTVLFTSGGCQLLFQVEIIFRSFFSMGRQRAARLVLRGNDCRTHDILARRRVGAEASKLCWLSGARRVLLCRHFLLAYAL